MMNKEGGVGHDVTKDIEDIVDEFDFETVKKVMDFLEWEWFTADDGVPRIGELRKKARTLLGQVAFKVLVSTEVEAESYISTGGFRASAYKFEDKVKFRLTFELAEYDNFD
jgi:hypothetical protein